MQRRGEQQQPQEALSAALLKVAGRRRGKGAGFHRVGYTWGVGQGRNMKEQMQQLEHERVGLLAVLPRPARPRLHTNPVSPQRAVSEKRLQTPGHAISPAWDPVQAPGESTAGLEAGLGGWKTWQMVRYTNLHFAPLTMVVWLAEHTDCYYTGCIWNKIPYFYLHSMNEDFYVITRTFSLWAGCMVFVRFLITSHLNLVEGKHWEWKRPGILLRWC